MPATARVIVLRLSPSGESYLKLDVLGPDCGAVICLQRISSKGGNKARPDLFDTADLGLEQARGGSAQFVRDFLPVRKRPGIGRSYRQLEAASHLCMLMAQNAGQMPEPGPLYRLLEAALDALNDGKDASLVELKLLFRLARDEGYPVRESWWPSLASGQRSALEPLLTQPVPVDLDETGRETCRRACRSLWQWLGRETDLRLPPGID